MMHNKLIPFMDTAYPGFASGNFETDVKVVRKFAAMGF